MTHSKITLLFILFVSLVTSVCAFSQDIQIDTFMLFKDEAGRPEYRPNGEQIAYHKRTEDNYYDIFLCDTRGQNDTCLTCDHPQLPNKHIGQPSWHPNERYIIFQAEKEDHVLPRVGALAAPGIGFHNDIYVLDLKTGNITQLTNLQTKSGFFDKTPSCGILQPHFSPDGSTVSWSERYEDGGDWGKWKIQVADFNVNENGTPALQNIRSYTPGVNKGYYESNDFVDDTTLLICGNLENKQTELGLDIYYLNLNSGDTTRLTHSLNYFDECPHHSKDGKYICYLSTQGFEQKDNKRWWSWAKGEFYIMHADGSHKQQITFMNTSGHPHDVGGRVVPAYISWSPDGKTILLGIVKEYKRKKLKDVIYKVSLK